MDKKKKEDIKTIILFCLMFIGINYILYNFLILPRTIEIGAKEIEFIQEGQNKDYFLSKKDEETQLLTEIELLKESAKDYDFMVLDGIDTINMCYDFYQYFKDHAIIGKSIQFTGIEDLAGINQEASEGSAEQGIPAESTDGLEPTAPATEVAEEPVIIDMLNKEYYKNVGITITLEMDKTKFNNFLKDLDTITNQKIYVKQITVDVTKEIDVESTETQPIEAQPTETQPTETQPIENQVGTENIQEIMTVTLSYNAYIKLDAVISDQPVSYTFYTKKEGVENVEDLFSAGWEKSEID